MRSWRRRVCAYEGGSVIRSTCPKCGHIIVETETTTLPIRCMEACGYVDTNGESITEVDKPIEPRRFPTLVRNYSTAVAKWYAAGKPSRTGPEVNAIVEKCRNCPGGYFKHKTCTHATCGCNVRTVSEEQETLVGFISPALINKARMGTEHCPIGEW
jgi:hypothetical protein